MRQKFGQRQEDSRERDVRDRGDEEGVSEGKERRRRWGTSDTGNAERTGKVNALDRNGDIDGVGVVGRRSARYESNSSVGTQVEYFPNIMAGEPLRAPVIRCVCVSESSFLQRKQVAYSTVLIFSMNVRKTKYY